MVRYFVLQVPSVGYYFVRLYFAEILYTSTTPRRFNVSIEGVPVLANFEVTLVQAGVLREFFVPVTDGSADITFIRGEIGDPMISAIAVSYQNACRLSPLVDNCKAIAHSSLCSGAGHPCPHRNVCAQHRHWHRSRH